MMIAVAVVAATIWGLMLWSKAVHYRSVARNHALMERSFVTAVIEGPNSADRDELARLSRIWAAHNAALRRKYEYAAAQPWAPVPPDPPEPFPLSRPGRRVDIHLLGE